MPALFTRISTSPRRSRVCANICVTLSELETSQTIAIAPLPISAATCPTCSAVRAAMAMRAPSRAKANAMARPMPRPPPVISAIFPFSIYLVAGKSRVALFEKRAHAFVTVFRVETTQLRLGFITQHLVEIRTAAHVDRLLRGCQRDRRRGTQTTREFQRRILQLFRRDYLVHDIQPRRFRGIDSVAEKEHLACFVWSDKPRQEVGAAPVRVQSDLYKRLAERGIARRDAQVAP